MTMSHAIGYLLGAFFMVYFVLYPIIYFGWNWAVSLAGIPQYAIPGFWTGMLFFFLALLVKNIFFNKSSKE